MKQENLNKINSKISKLVEDFSKEKFKASKFIPGKTSIPCSGKVIDSWEGIAPESKFKSAIDAALEI